MSQFVTNALRSRSAIAVRFGIIVAVVGGLIWAFSAPARSQEQDIRWAQRQMGYICTWSGECYKPYRTQHQHYRHHRRPEQYGQRYRTYHEEWERVPQAEHYTVRPRGYDYHADVREDYDERFDDRRGRRHDECRPPVRVLSTEHNEEGSAKDAATKLWMAETQDQHGTRYMDLMNARDIGWRCGASNAHDTFSGRWSEAIAKAQGKDGQNVRCRLWATPCLGPIVKDEKGRRER